MNVTISPGVRAAAHGRSASASADETHRGTAFYEVHWYHTPWLFVLEMLLDSACLEASPWDLAYLTELDPLWDDSAAAFILAPESALFANPAAWTWGAGKTWPAGGEDGAILLWRHRDCCQTSVKAP